MCYNMKTQTFSPTKHTLSGTVGATVFFTLLKLWIYATATERANASKTPQIIFFSSLFNGCVDFLSRLDCKIGVAQLYVYALLSIQ